MFCNLKHTYSYEDSAFIYPASANRLPPAPPRVTYHHYNQKPGCIRIEWNTAQDKAEGYKIYRAERKGGPYNLLKEMTKKEAEDSQDYKKIGKMDGIEGSYYAHYDDKQVIPQVTYYYVVTTLVGKVESRYSLEYSKGTVTEKE
ncbi:MAG: hypothetical protein QME07_07375 [bacterium]|nr:hypothetical protein [bacterium]